MQEFFYMDGKAFFVWGAYGITVLVLALGMVLASRRTKKILREIEQNLEQ
ncbi:MAG: heme exporter protein CcmD [Gammaproteobacteria bacterium]|nr:heme exporter protein CcmD [Gammaproteobacteria bacterium]